MKRRPPLSTIAAFVAALCYVCFAFVAFSQYPGAFSPLGNWLSDLGSRSLNPRGALFYNTAVISASLALGVFFLGLSNWQIGHLRMQKVMLRTTQAFGLLGCLAMAMSALYPIDCLPQHSFWSISLYALLGTSFVFSVFALRYHPQCPRWVLVLGGITGLVDIISSFFGSVYVMEWLTVALFLCYILVVGIITRAVAA